MNDLYLPRGFTWRDLWLAELTNGTSIPSLVTAGNNLTLTGGVKGTSANGVHFTGAATSNINAGAIENAATKLWLSFRFKPDQTFATGAAADQYLFGKYIDADNYIEIWLENADGKLYFKNRTAAVDRFSISSAETSWTVGTWYHVLASISSAAGARLRINNGTAVTNADTTAAPNGGDFIIGDFDDPGAGTGFIGTMEDFFAGTDDLTAAEETFLFKGGLPFDAVHAWMLDEGRGTTATDRGSGANNGTLDSACTWAWIVKSPVISLDGINDYASSGAVLDISGNTTFIWVGKLKHSAGPSVTARFLYKVRVDANNEVYLLWNSDGNLRWYAVGNGVSDSFSFGSSFTIDQYAICVGALTTAGAFTGWLNGVAPGAISSGPRTAGGATLYLGNTHTGSYYGNDKPILVGRVEGVMDTIQARILSRNINKALDLGISL